MHTAVRSYAIPAHLPRPHMFVPDENKSAIARVLT